MFDGFKPDLEAKAKRKHYRGINNIYVLNGQTYCENTLRKGKIWHGYNGIINPPRFANLDFDKIKAVNKQSK